MSDQPITHTGGRGSRRVYADLTIGQRKAGGKVLPRIPYGFRVQPHPRRGTGKLAIDNLRVINADVGALIDPSVSTTNGDVLSFGGHFHPMHCGVGFQANARMHMGHTFGVVWPYGTETAFQYNAGGDLKVNCIIATHGCKTLLDVVESGANNGSYDLGTIKMDAQLKGCQWIKTRNPHAARFIVRAASMGGSHRRGDTLVELRGPQTADLHNVHQLAAGNIITHEQRRKGRAADVPSINLWGCVLKDPLKDIVPGRAWVQTIGCRLPSGQPVPNEIHDWT